MDSTQPTLAASSIASWAGGKELTIISQSLSNLFPFFFSTKDVTIGPTAIMAIMTGEVFSGDKEVCDNYLDKGNDDVEVDGENDGEDDDGSGNGGDDGDDGVGGED